MRPHIFKASDGWHLHYYTGEAHGYVCAAPPCLSWEHAMSELAVFYQAGYIVRNW